MHVLNNVARANDSLRQGTQGRVADKATRSYLDMESQDEAEESGFTEQTATLINEKLTMVGVPQLSGPEQIQLADIVECVALVERHRRSMDENGARFMLYFRQHALRKGRSNEMQLSWREINWAYHSTSQDILVNLVSRQDHGGILWEQARESGIFMWLSDINTLVCPNAADQPIHRLTRGTEVAV